MAIIDRKRGGNGNNNNQKEPKTVSVLNGHRIKLIHNDCCYTCVLVHHPERNFFLP